MNKVLLGALVAIVVLAGGTAFAKPIETPVVASSPHVTVSYDDQTFPDQAFVAGLTENEQTELPDTMVSEFSAVKDQDAVSAPSAKSAPVEVSAPRDKMV